jgi:S1-C subfamily serine protease
MCAIVTTAASQSSGGSVPVAALLRDPADPAGAPPAWDDSRTVNALDVVLLALLALAAVSGHRRGFALQACAFGGLLAGLAVGALLAPRFAGLAGSPGVQAAIAASTLLVLAAVGDTAGWLLGNRVRERARATRLGQADAAGGSVVAVAASLLAIWFVALNLANGPFPGIANGIQGSAIVRTLDDALPRPPSMLAEARRFFNRFGFPDVFSGIPPLPAAPVEPPRDVDVRAAFDAAAPSTVMVFGEACGHVQEGSGFVASDGYIVTNAHVLAGVGDPFVRSPAGEDQRAITVLFDPDLDLAVLFVEDSPGPVLPLARQSPARGDDGAVLGYPGGGPLSSGAAAVLRALSVSGPDIYGTGEADRLVLELQTVVRPGNSGGPFVLADGTVGGVVFAASSSEDDLGYAISSEDVRARLVDAVGDTAAVGTGPCMR